jgi:hypothetical protein
MTATVATTKRPTSCGALFAIDPTLGSKGCKRLPRHGGEHRGHLTASAERKAVRAATVVAKPRKVTRKAAAKSSLNDIVRDIRTNVGQARGRLSAAKRREALGLLSVAVEAGRLSAGDALGLVARF